MITQLGQRSFRAFRAALLDWGRGRRDDLPWRNSTDPWRILVSEVMLQQTQASRVVPHYRDFVAAFPTPAACARASTAEIVRHWQGLGYNRRATYLHRAAGIIHDEHGGRVPDTVSALLDLPGVGPYTARAVASLAFDADVGVIDTNIGRVLSRAIAGRRLPRPDAQRMADDLVPAGSSRAWNQAVMDLGALVCTKRSPDCDGCPVRRWCGWAQQGWLDPDPAEGTAGASRPQSRFEGSDRQGRGRLVDALRRGPVAVDDLPEAIGWPDQPGRARRVAEGLVDDGLAEAVGDSFRLPSESSTSQTAD